MLSTRNLKRAGEEEALAREPTRRRSAEPGRYGQARDRGEPPGPLRWSCHRRSSQRPWRLGSSARHVPVDDDLERALPAAVLVTGVQVPAVEADPQRQVGGEWLLPVALAASMNIACSGPSSSYNPWAGVGSNVGRGSRVTPTRVRALLVISQASLGGSLGGSPRYGSTLPAFHRAHGAGGRGPARSNPPSRQGRERYPCRPGCSATLTSHGLSGPDPQWREVSPPEPERPRRDEGIARQGCGEDLNDVLGGRLPGHRSDGATAKSLGVGIGREVYQKGRQIHRLQVRSQITTWGNMKILRGLVAAR